MTVTMILRQRGRAIRSFVTTRGRLTCPKYWEPVGHLQGSLGPSEPETPKMSEKSLQGPPAPGPPRVWKKSRKGLFGTFWRHFPDSRDFFETFSRLSGGPGAGGPERLFSDFFGVSGPEGPRDPCKWPTGSQPK